MRKINDAFALTESATSSLVLSAMNRSPVYASGFIGDAALKGNIFYWQHQRDRKEADPTREYKGQYRADLHHTSLNTHPDFQSGYARAWTGLDPGVFAAAGRSRSALPAPTKLASVRLAPAGMKSGMATAAERIRLEP